MKIQHKKHLWDMAKAVLRGKFIILIQKKLLEKQHRACNIPVALVSIT